MRRVHFNDIVDKVRDMCMDANYNLSADVTAAYEKAMETEKSPLGQEVLRQIMENSGIAARESMPLCQDTGLAVFFVEIGQDVSIAGGLLSDAINEGVRQGYSKGYLRKSVVEEPIFNRRNTSDNTPAIIHTDIVAGEDIRIKLDIAGGGCEKAAILAKKALLRPVGQPNARMDVASLEQDLLRKVNQTGIGPVGLGGTTTALAVHVEVTPCHIASLPVAVNIGCHSSRHKSIVI